MSDLQQSFQAQTNNQVYIYRSKAVLLYWTIPSGVRDLTVTDDTIRRKPSALAYRIVESDSNPGIGVVEWDGTVDLTADELVGYGTPTKDREIDVAVVF